MKILIIGYGSIGQKHFKTIKENFSHFVFAAHHKDLEEVVKWKNFDVAVICTPTNTHLKYAIKCAELGIKNIFIEKPLDCSAELYPEFRAIVEQKKITTYVAYPFRFNDEIKRAKSVLKEDYTIVCQTDISKWYHDGRIRSIDQGGGPLLELSHELDIAEYLFGEYEMYGMPKFSDEGMTKGQILIKTYHSSGREGMIFLNTESDRESRAIVFGSGSFFYQIEAINYVRQFQWFFENLGMPSMMNDIFDAYPLFSRILKVQERIIEGKELCVSF